MPGPRRAHRFNLWAAAWLVHIGCCAQANEGPWPAERAAGAFVCHADFSLQQYDRLWHEMARLQHDLNATLHVAVPREPIHLFLFAREHTYREYLKLHFPQVPSRRALYVKERGPGMVFAHLSDEFDVDVRHEGTHALLHATLPLVPLWLDEGLAEYFELPPDQRAYGHPALGKTRWAARFGQPPPLERLEELADLSQMGPTEYRQAWAWVHFLIHGSAEGREELIHYLDDLAAHMPPGRLSQRLRSRRPDVQQAFLEHFRNWGPQPPTDRN